MAIANVEISNTFNEFRQSVNETINQLNYLTSAVGAVANVATELTTGWLQANTVSVTDGVQSNNLTTTAVVYVDADNYLKTESTFTYDDSTNTLRADNLNVDSAIITSTTPTRVLFTDNNGTIVDDSGLTYDASSNTLYTHIVSSNKLNANNLTDGRVLVAGADGLVTDDAGLSYEASSNTLHAHSIKTNNISANNLTSGRVAIVGADGLIADDAELVYHTSNNELQVSQAKVTGNADVDGTLSAGETTLSSATISDLTANRVVLAGTSGAIEDNQYLSFSSNTLITPKSQLTDTTDSSSVSTGSFTTPGGVGIAKNLYVGGTAELLSNVVIGGNLTVQGNTIQIDVSQVKVEDPIIHLAANNETSDSLDIGFVGHYSTDAGATKRHTGLIRDASTGKYRLFYNYIDSGLDDSGTTLDVSNASFANADLVVGDLDVKNLQTTGNVVTGKLTASGLTTLATANVDTLNVSGSSNFAGSVSIGSTINMQSHSITRNDIGSTSGAQEIDLALGNYVTAYCTGGMTWTFTLATGTAAKAVGFVLELRNGGAYTQTWPASVQWPSDVAPTLTAGIDAYDVLVFITHDGGSTWRGALAMLDSR